jgi:hypothetical protein
MRWATLNLFGGSKPPVIPMEDSRVLEPEEQQLVATLRVMLGADSAPHDLEGNVVCTSDSRRFPGVTEEALQQLCRAVQKEAGCGDDVICVGAHKSLSPGSRAALVIDFAKAAEIGLMQKLSTMTFEPSTRGQVPGGV